MVFYHGRRVDEEHNSQNDAVLFKLKFYSFVPKCANEYVKIERMNMMEIILMVNILNCYCMNYQLFVQ